MQIQPRHDGDSSLSSIHTLVHFGAGRCRELDAHLALKPQRILLIEADPHLSEILRERSLELPQVSVLGVAVAGQAGPGVLHRYNLPDANSLHPAEGLLRLFQGLRLQERLPLETQLPSSVVAPLDLVGQDDHLLIIDLPGEEFPVLQALQRSGHLALFRHLRLCCGCESLYEGSEPATRILDWLQEQGFDVVSRDDSQDPDQPCWTLKRSLLKLQNRELAQRCEALEGACDEQSKLAAERQKAVEALQAERAGLVKEKATLSAARDEQAKLAAERQKAVEALQAEKAGLVKEKASLSAARDEQAKLAAERQKAVEALQSGKAGLVKEKASLSAARDAQAKLAAERQKAVEALQSEKAGLVKEKASLSAARDEQAKLAAERQKAVEALQAEKAGLVKEKASLSAARDEQAKLVQTKQAEINKQKNRLDESQDRIRELESRVAEMDRRQALMNEEMAKTEGQIELIKDLLLRDTLGQADA